MLNPRAQREASRLAAPERCRGKDGVAFFDLAGTKLGLYGLEALCEDISPETRSAKGFGGITIAHNTLPLDRPPIALYARTGEVEVATGIRIGITKAVELPWRYGVRGSKFLSKPFPK